MITFFVRHTTNIGIDDGTRERLWREHRVAIHYPRQKNGKLGKTDLRSVNPDDYAGPGRRCMKALTDLACLGGYVCAQHYPHEQWMLGFVKPDSKIEFLKGKWSDTSGCKGRTAVLKTLRLSKVKLVDPGDFAVMSVGRPRQGTIMRWHLAGEHIQKLVEGKRRKTQLSDLTHDQQEILCGEFLRLAKAKSFRLPRLAHLLLPSGGTMKDIDIIGIATDGRRILAQVTFSPLSASAWKIDRLLPYRDPKRAHLLFFCDCAKRIERDGVIVFPLRRAYEVFASTNLGKLWVRG